MDRKNSDAWLANLIADPAERDRAYSNAAMIERVFSILAALFAVAAVWGFTSTAGPLLGFATPASVGGIAVLCFAASMAVAANGGIRKRFITMIGGFQAQARP